MSTPAYSESNLRPSSTHLIVKLQRTLAPPTETGSQVWPGHDAVVGCRYQQVAVRFAALVQHAGVTRSPGEGVLPGLPEFSI